MKIRFAKSVFEKKCAICEAITVCSLIFEEDDISIRVPICDREDNDCRQKLDIKETTTTMLQQLKQEVTQ